MATLIATITTLMPSTAHQQQQQGQHTYDFPHGGGGRGNVSGGRIERTGNGRGSVNGGSRRGEQLAGWLVAVQGNLFQSNFF
jgi:hypothetical protein